MLPEGQRYREDNHRDVHHRLNRHLDSQIWLTQFTFFFGSFAFTQAYSFMDLVWSHPGKHRFHFYQLLLRTTILPYAFLYLTRDDSRDAIQKLAILGKMLSLKFTGLEFKRARTSP